MNSKSAHQARWRLRVEAYYQDWAWTDRIRRLEISIEQALNNDEIVLALDKLRSLISSMSTARCLNYLDP